MDTLHLLIVFPAGVVGGSFGTLVGGGGLITIPTLMLLGLPPHTAIGTNRMGVSGMAIAGWYGFNKKGMINYRIACTMAIPALFGPILGAHLVLRINEEVLRQVVAVITILILVFIISRPKMGIQKVNDTIRKHEYLMGAVLSLFIFMYSGFYGAGAGTFLTYVLILLFGQAFLESAATRKIAQLISTGVATIVFALSGVVSYPAGATLFAGSFTGSYVGTHFSDRIGDVWIKRLFFVFILTMAIKLLA
jgi:uncharacterized membrane protein YfcA